MEFEGVLLQYFYSTSTEIALIIVILFFAFLDDLGNFRHFEPYLFFFAYFQKYHYLIKALSVEAL